MRGLIQEKFDESVQYAQKRKEIFDSIYDNPELIITKLFNGELNQHYELGVKMLHKSGVKHHDLQKELLKLVRHYFTNIDKEIDVRLGQYMSYPATMRIVYKNQEIVSFNIYRHVFGDFRREMSLDLFDNEMDANNELIKKQKENLEEYEAYDGNLFKVVFNHYKSKKISIEYIRLFMRDIYSVITKKEEIETNINKSINAIKREIENLKNRNKEIGIRKQEYVIKQPGTDKKVSEWRKRFIDWGYEEMPKRSHRLY